MSRTVNFGVCVATYPDKRVFAFSPYRVEITGTDVGQAVTFTYNGFTSKRYTNNDNKVIIEISGLLQSFFAGLEFGQIDSLESKTILIDKKIKVSVETFSGTYNHDMMYDVIWGALQLGETEPSEDTIYRFGDLPLTLTNNIGTHFNYNTFVGISPTITGTFGRDILIESTMTTPFYFKDGATIKKSIKLIEQIACQNSYYLRWIDRYGNYRYYSFLFGKKTEQTKLGTAYNYNVMSLEPSAGLIKQPAQLISKQFGEVVIVSEPSADDIKTAHIRSIFTSPKVWLYVGVNWMEVAVAENELTENYNEGAREINVSIIMPKKYSQEL